MMYSEYENNVDPITRKASSSEVLVDYEQNSDEDTVATAFLKTSWKSVESSMESSPKPSKTRFSWWALNGEEPITSHSIKKRNKKAKTRHSCPVTETEHKETIKCINKSLDKKKKKRSKSKSDKKKSKNTKRKQRKEKKYSSGASESAATHSTAAMTALSAETMEQEASTLQLDAALALQINARKLHQLARLQESFENHQDELLVSEHETDPPLNLETLFHGCAALNNENEEDFDEYEEETIHGEGKEVICEYYEQKVSSPKPLRTRRLSL
ncbi:unnamed protein product [Cylindrotheca closterium]|uniref:Uncharacterized protein n=1 Tax=Cylindrotheca closterium TaxID=2856 RepID=A0AAD2CNV3_9STRA|nr:unnamed protein product [Cylindrotheca closterium]